MTSFTYIYETDAAVTAEAIWSLYEDVTSWPRWDAGAARVTRDGAFQTGSTGTLTPVGQEPLSYRLVHVDPLREFVDETPVGELVVRVAHRLRPLDGGRLRITYRAEVDGPADQAQQVGSAVTADFPDTVASLIAMAAGSER